MSTPSQLSVIEDLLSKLPSISKRWNKHCSEWCGEEAGVYIDIAVIAHHLKSLYPARQTKNNRIDASEFPLFFEQVEEFYSYQEKEINELLTIGLFEALQNITASEYGQWTRFEPWLGGRSRKAWDQLIQTWNGNTEQD